MSNAAIAVGIAIGMITRSFLTAVEGAEKAADKRVKGADCVPHNYEKLIANTFSISLIEEIN